MEKSNKRLRIILCGASSVGKTTISKKLRENHRQFCSIDEIAREIMRTQCITTNHLKESLLGDKQLYLEFQKQILRAQLCRERQLDMENASFVSDRGPDNIAYAGHYVSEEAQQAMEDLPEAKELLLNYQSSLVLMILPLDHVIDDGVRLVMNREEQLAFTDRLETLLRKNNVKFIEIPSATIHERNELVERALQSYYC